MRKNIANAWNYVNCIWVFDPEELYAFEEKYYYLTNSAESFLIDLMLVGPIKEYEAVFVPQSKKTNSMNGVYYQVSATLMVKPNDFDNSTISKMMLVDIYGSIEAAEEILNLLEKLVNVDLPKDSDIQ